jgi:hypothetical protein
MSEFWAAIGIILLGCFSTGVMLLVMYLVYCVGNKWEAEDKILEYEKQRKERELLEKGINI